MYVQTMTDTSLRIQQVELRKRKGKKELGLPLTIIRNEIVEYLPLLLPSGVCWLRAQDPLRGTVGETAHRYSYLRSQS